MIFIFGTPDSALGKSAGLPNLKNRHGSCVTGGGRADLLRVSRQTFCLKQHNAVTRRKKAKTERNRRDLDAGCRALPANSLKDNLIVLGRVVSQCHLVLWPSHAAIALDSNSFDSLPCAEKVPK